MAERLSRKALYDLVWSEPVKVLAARFGISDVGLRKTCEKAGIPTPDRGYWAKKEAGKTTYHPALPLRSPGMGDEVSVAGGSNNWYSCWSDEELLGPIPPSPEFPETIEAVRARIVEAVGQVTVPRNVHSWHPAVERLLKEDQKRREKQLSSPYHFSWDDPKFDTSFERRRLRILSSLFFAVGKMNGKVSISGEAREFCISFFQQLIHLRLDKPKKPSRRSTIPNATDESDDVKLCLAIVKGWGSEEVITSWQDDDAQKLESQMTEIAVQIVLTAEIKYRESALYYHQLRIERKAKLEEEERKRKLEAERAARERIRRIEQARVDRLLRDAKAFQLAGEIRKYVEAIRTARAGDDNISNEEFKQWSQWALAQADRIDPTVGKTFLNAMQDDVETNT